MTKEEALLSAAGLRFAYPGAGGVSAIRGVSLAIARGSFCGLIGPNGCGKSTLLRLLAGVLPPAEGEVLIGGRRLSELAPRARATHIAYVPQQTMRAFPFTALEVVLTGRSPYTSRFRFETRRDREVAMAALDGLGASDLAARPITELSGGEQQMVSVARALAQEAELLLLDEPSASLDLKHRGQLLASLARIRQERSLTALVVTHDLQMLEPAFDSILAMRRGELAAAGPPPEVLREEVLAEVYEDANVRARQVAGRTFVWSEW